MTRITALILLTFALTLSGCKKKPAAAQPDPKVAATTAGSAPATATAPGEPAPPSAPDFTPAASGATTVPKPPAKPGIDLNASVIVLCYHDIGKPQSKALWISLEQFESEMQAIKDAGFAVIGMQDFLAWRRGEKSIPAKSCIITIDDGWVSGYTNAWPVLKKHGYPFTLFVYINYIGTGGKSLSWAQLGEMRDAGVDIQSHTYSHANLKNPTLRGSLDARNMALVQKDLATLGREGWMTKEIAGSKKVLEDQLGIKVSAIAYPQGVHSEAAHAAVKAANYEAAFSVYGQRLTRDSPDVALGRYAIDAKNPKVFKDALAMIGGGGGTVASLPTTMGQLAAAAMVTQPMEGETITNPLPQLKANLASMGDVDPASIVVRLSGQGTVPHQFNADSKLMTAQVLQKLPPGSYRVLLSAKVVGVPKDTSWSFNVAQTAGAAMAATPTPRLNVATPEPKATPKPKKK